MTGQDTAQPTLAGKVCLITGATSGIGAVTAEALARQGARVVLVGRSAEKCARTREQIQARTGNPDVETLLADLSSQQQVRQLAQDFRDRHARLDVLVNNAGGLWMKRQETAEGLEMTFAVNHLAYFLLTNLLLDRLRASAPARIVNVASAAHRRAVLRFDDLMGQKSFNGWRAYKRSKLANLLFTYELARRLEGTGVTANALHPGWVATGFASHNNGWFGGVFQVASRLFALRSEKGARTVIYLATAPEVANVSGQYFVKCRPVRSSRASRDSAAAERLWAVSEELTKLVEPSASGA
jgi:NAD(P)-dependent dehydrogenase (short-subunit alcohol dehydrogenase family)